MSYQRYELPSGYVLNLAGVNSYGGALAYGKSIATIVGGAIVVPLRIGKHYGVLVRSAIAP